MEREPWMDTQGGAADDQLHRRYVGPVERWPRSAGHQFAVVTAEGLETHHVLVDLGCGPLCAGTKLIPWLDVGRYVGVEPNEEALSEGIQREGLWDLTVERECRFAIGTVEQLPRLVEQGQVPAAPDMVLMHSVFSHMRPSLMRASMRAMRLAFDSTVPVLASFAVARVHDPQLDEGDQWLYPGLVHYLPRIVERIAAQNGWTVAWRPYAEPGKQRWARLTA